MRIKKIQNWVENKLISVEQADKIIAFEREKYGGLQWQIMFSIAGIFIGLGVIFLIGSNWDVIPTQVKLVGDFALFGGVLFGAYHCILEKKQKLKELFLILSFFMVGATIGLIAQIFNLDGGWTSFAFSWGVLGSVFVLLSRRFLFNVAWLVLLGTGIEWDFLEFLFRTAYEAAVCSVFFTALFSYAGKLMDEEIKGRIVLFNVFSKLMFVLMYFSVIISGITSGFGYGALVPLVFLFLGVRMAMAFNRQNFSSFRNNALLVELYIFYLFVANFGESLFKSGIGFIMTGIFLLFVIYSLRKTSGYIKNMEIFNEK